MLGILIEAGGKHNRDDRSAERSSGGYVRADEPRVVKRDRYDTYADRRGGGIAGMLGMITKEVVGMMSLEGSNVTEMIGILNEALVVMLGLMNLEWSNVTDMIHMLNEAVVGMTEMLDIGYAEPRPPIYSIGGRVNQKGVDEKRLCNDLSNNGRFFYQALDKLNSCIGARFKFSAIAIARIVNALSKKSDKRHLKTVINYLIQSNLLETRISSFKPQELAMIANGASKCGKILCEEVMRGIKDQIMALIDSLNHIRLQRS